MNLSNASVPGQTISAANTRKSGDHPVEVRLRRPDSPPTSGPEDGATVRLRYLGKNPANPDYTDRGMSGIDLVDVLDGMVCRGHMSWGNGTKLLNQMMDFDYDFTPTNSDCP